MQELIAREKHDSFLEISYASASLQERKALRNDQSMMFLYFLRQGTINL